MMAAIPLVDLGRRWRREEGKTQSKEERYRIQLQCYSMKCGALTCTEGRKDQEHRDGSHRVQRTEDRVRPH